MKGVFQALVVASMAFDLASGQAATCPLDCLNDSNCIQGAGMNYDDHPKDANGQTWEFLREVSRQGWFCDCPDGLAGIRCGREFEKCEDTGHYCYHGGKCIPGLADKVDADKLFCDCRDATHNGFPYVGKYCEHRGADQCGDSEVFCSNGGTCKDGFETKAHPCNCPDGHRGDHCEFLLGQVPECDLDCNGGTCKLGIKDYDTAMYNQFWALHDGHFEYCECPDGQFGPQCEIQGEQCGDFHCFNGAHCIQTNDKDNNVSFRCDCNTASTNDKSFAGQFCQSESTSFCSKEADHNGHLFCTNGGTCLDETHEGCSCPEGFHGPICEFHDESMVEECTLNCQNEGKCRKGTKDNQIIKQYGAALSKFNMTHSELWEHCVCPQGFFGIQCEHKLEICPGGDHVCLHGSRCVPTEEARGGTGHSCDCDHGHDAFERYAGKFCQYSSTDICTESGQPGVGKANFAFCVNNGKCKKKVKENQPHPGCECTDAFKGDHCEFLNTNEEAQTEAPVVDPQTITGAANAEDEYPPNEGLVIGLAVALIALAGVLVFAIVKRSMYNRELANASKDTITEGAESAPAAENNSVAPPPTDDAATDTSEPSGPTPFEAEETVEGADDSIEKEEMTTVEIV